MVTYALFYFKTISIYFFFVVSNSLNPLEANVNRKIMKCAQIFDWAIYT